MHQSERCSLVIRIQHDILLIKEAAAAAFCKIVNSNSLSLAVCVFAVCAHGYRRKERGSSAPHGLWIFWFAVSLCKKFKYIESVCVCAGGSLFDLMDGMGGLLLHSYPSLLSFGSVCRNIMSVHTHTRSYQQNCYYTFRFLGPGAVLWLYLKHISFALCAAFYWNKSHITVRARAIVTITDTFIYKWKRAERRNLFCEINVDFAHAEK